MLSVLFEWRASVKPRGRTTLEKHIRSTFQKFFHYESSDVTVSLIIYELTRGGLPHDPIVHAPTRVHYETDDGIPVKVWTGGTQAALCCMSIEGYAKKDLIALLTSGPSSKTASSAKTEKTNGRASSSETELPEKSAEKGRDKASHPQRGLSGGQADKPEVAQEARPPAKTDSKSEMSVYEKLVFNGVSEEEIFRLKATLAAILYKEHREQGYQRLPNTLQVPVTHITEAILDHMELPYNAAGTYRGTIANFYATRIALFALKWEDSLDPDSRYTDWLFDCKRVVDFVGNKNKLVALAQERSKEVRERKQKETKLPVDIPTIDQLERALEQAPISDEEVVELLQLFRKVQKCSDRRLRLAIENEANQQQIVDDLRAQLEEEEKNLAVAKAQRQKAESDRESFELPQDLAQKIIGLRDEVNALVRDLGLEQ